MKSVNISMYFAILLCAVFSVSNYQIAAQIKDVKTENWYCDKRLDLKLLAGVVLEIVPYKKDSKNAPIEKFSDNEIEYESVNVVKIKAVEFDTGKESANEFEYFNVRTKNYPAKEFRVGEKYLFESSRLPVNPFGKGRYEYKLDFIKPNGFLKLYSEASEEIELFKKYENFDIFEQVLGVRKNKAVRVGVLAGSILNAPRPILPKNVKLTEQETVKVLVLIDEKGNVSKEKAVCASHPEIALAAENAAKMVKSRPTMLDGKAVKITRFLFYQFSGY